MTQSSRLAVTACAAVLFLARSASPQTCPTYFPAVATGTVQDARIDEASGMVASAENPGIYWVHNDSGDSARFFAVAEDGTVLATYNLTGAGAIDWEDMARGRGPDPGVSYLYFADIGDNGATRSSITVYRVPEPTIPIGPGADIDLGGAVALEMEYPDTAHDAETLLADPLTGDLYVVTKCFLTSGCNDGVSKVFRYAFPHQDGMLVTLDDVGSVAFTGNALQHAATSGDISPAGDRIALRTYNQAFVWNRGPGDSVADALAGTRCPVPLAAEPQGETIAFSFDGVSYTTLSELTGQPLQRADERFADGTVSSRALIARDRSSGSDPAARRLSATGVATGTATIAGDPTVRGAVLEVSLDGANPTAQTFVLLPGVDANGGPLWSQLSSGGFRYSDPDGERGPVARVLLRRSNGGRLTLKVSADGGNGALDLVPPNPGSAGFATLRIPGGDRYCVRYGAEGRTRNDGAKLFRLSGETPEACPP